MRRSSMRHHPSAPALSFRLDFGRQGLACATHCGRCPTANLTASPENYQPSVDISRVRRTARELSRTTAGTVMLPSPSKPRLLRMTEGMHAGRVASEPQDRVTELIEQQTAISEVLRAIANSPHDLQPIFDAILDSATRLCRADIGTLRVCEENGFRLVAVRGDPLFVSQAWSSIPVLVEKG